MKLFTAENVELMEVTSIEASTEGLVVQGQIMGAMPMSAVLTAPELRRALRLLNWKIAFAILRMLVRGR